MGQTIKKAEHQRTDAFNCGDRRTLESSLDNKEIRPVSPKGNQSWIFIGKIDAEVPIFSPPDAKNWFIGKDPDPQKDWVQEEKGMTEGAMVGLHHRLNGHEFEHTPGDSEGQEGSHTPGNSEG